MLLGATNVGREGLPSYMRQRIAPLVSLNVTKSGHEPNGMKLSPKQRQNRDIVEL